MEIIDFPRTDEDMKSAGATLLAQCFSHAYGDCAEEQIALCMEEERIALAAVDKGELVGFIGAIPQYGVTGWELHPLAVAKTHRKKGVGRSLVESLEWECAARGGITIYLGTDDEFGQTTLSQGDLFENTLEKIAGIKNLKEHPYEFYQRVGFQIVGVLPDVNGMNKPDIWMAKRLAQSEHT